jgi:hypothetical protein
LLTEVYTGQPRKVQGTFQIHVDYSKRVRRFFSHALECEVRTNEILLLPEPGIRDGVIDSSESLICCIEECEIVGIRGHVAGNEFDSSFGGVQFFLEGLSWFFENIPEENMGTCFMEETNEASTDANGALVKVRVGSQMYTYTSICITYTCKNNYFAVQACVGRRMKLVGHGG